MATPLTRSGLSPELGRCWAGLGIPADYALARRMPRQRAAKKLAVIGRNSDGRLIRLTPRAAAAWRRMQTAAGRAGVVLLPLSGFRSIARQSQIIRQKLAAGGRLAHILRLVAAPGCSEHHTGRALDLGAPGHVDLDEHFARTAAFRWLQEHAARFGFHLTYPRQNPHGIGYEPWHWCWRSPDRG